MEHMNIIVQNVNINTMSNMKQITTTKGTYLFVKVPNDVYNFRYKTMPDSSWQLVGTIKDEDGNIGTCYIKDNPIGEIISTTNQITKEQAESIVDFKNISSVCNCEYCGFDVDCWRDYVNQSEDDWNKYPTADRLRNAKESLQSLIKANELDETKNYLILKKVE